MPRAIEFETTVDTSTFSALQLQPRAASALTWNALARWLRVHLVPFPRLIAEERTGLVVMSFHLEYRELVPFFECEAFRVRAALRLMRRGERGRLDVRFHSDGADLAAAQLVLCPVRIEDPIALGATPAALPDHLLSRLRPDELESASPERLVPERLAALETTKACLAETSRPFLIHRHLSEVAEQWSWTEVPSLLEESRDHLALERGAAEPRLRDCLRRPLRRLDLEFGRPFFSYEQGEVVTRAYWRDEGLRLLHRLTSGGGTSLHATAVEAF